MHMAELLEILLFSYGNKTKRFLNHQKMSLAMKESSNEFTDKFNRELEEVDEEKLYFEDGIHRILVPKKVLYDLEKRARHYEVDDIEDLNGNYGILSRTKFPPFSVLSWTIKTIPPLVWKYGGGSFSPPQPQEYHDLICDHHNRFSPKINLNFVSIDNVYLRNFSFIKKDSFEACEFDIEDRRDNQIRGVFIYRDSYRVIGGERESSQRQLEKVLDSPETSSFDLLVTAMSEDYKLNEKGVEKPRGKRLHVHNIHRQEEDKENLEIPQDDSTIDIPSTPLPGKALVFRLF